jgi:hypothetical protein
MIKKCSVKISLCLSTEKYWNSLNSPITCPELLFSQSAQWLTTVYFNIVVMVTKLVLRNFWRANYVGYGNIRLLAKLYMTDSIKVRGRRRLERIIPSKTLEVSDSGSSVLTYTPTDCKRLFSIRCHVANLSSPTYNNTIFLVIGPTRVS